MIGAAAFHQSDGAGEGCAVAALDIVSKLGD
jgi:hypothetical protein